MILRPKRDELILDKPGVLGFGGNSGFHALNLALQFGARQIILVGFDMTTRRGIHWHGRHAGGLNNPTDRSLARWAEVLDGQAGRLARLGAEVVNASPISALKAFPKATIEEALAIWARQ